MIENTIPQLFQTVPQPGTQDAIIKVRWYTPRRPLHPTKVFTLLQYQVGGGFQAKSAL